MSDDLPRIEGQKEVTTEPEERQKVQEVLEQASQMDLAYSIPANDEMPYKRDTDKGKSQEEIVESAKQNVKKYIPQHWEHSLPKARAALAAKREKARLQGKEASQGTPAPDLITHITKALDERMAPILTRLEDLKKVEAHQAPMQAQGVVQETEPVEAEFPAKPNNIVEVAATDEPNALPFSNSDFVQREDPDTQPKRPLHGPQFTSEPKRMKQQEGYVRKFKQAMQHFDFNTPEVHDRAAKDPLTHGMPSNVLKSNFIVF